MKPLILLAGLAMSSLAQAQTDRSLPTNNGTKQPSKENARPLKPGEHDPAITRLAPTNEVYVPRIVGDNFNRLGFAADLSRRSKGFTARVEEERDGTGLPKGQILSQTPKAGVQTKGPTEIAVVISSGL